MSNKRDNSIGFMVYGSGAVAGWHYPRVQRERVNGVPRYRVTDCPVPVDYDNRDDNGCVATIAKVLGLFENATIPVDDAITIIRRDLNVDCDVVPTPDNTPNELYARGYRPLSSDGCGITMGRWWMRLDETSGGEPEYIRTVNYCNCGNPMAAIILRFTGKQAVDEELSNIIDIDDDYAITLLTMLVINCSVDANSSAVPFPIMFEDYAWNISVLPRFASTINDEDMRDMNESAIVRRCSPRARFTGASTASARGGHAQPLYNT